MAAATKPILYVVHCIDTEGPLTETLEATFERVRKVFGVTVEPSQKNLELLQQKKLDVGGKEDAIARMLSPELLSYNNNWEMIGDMLDDAMSPAFRNRMLGDDGQGWAYSWHCLDHAGYSSNPRLKDTGYGSVFRFYRDKIAATKSTRDEINWHFHPLSFGRDPSQCATSYVNSFDALTQVLTRRIIDESWYPLVNRPGFHSERPDSHWFLEQWIPYDYANQFDESLNAQPDLKDGRLGDWRRASPSWRGYRPSHDDYQTPGDCRRWIFRCMNVGTRIRLLTEDHVREAFSEAKEKGSAILAFCDHDYRDLRPDVEYVRGLLAKVRSQFPGVEIRFAGAKEAARAHIATIEPVKTKPIRLTLAFEKGLLQVSIAEGQLFGPQPFLAIKTKKPLTRAGAATQYHHDNLDVQQPGKTYSYVFDDQTLVPEDIECIAVGAAGRDGSSDVQQLKLA